MTPIRYIWFVILALYSLRVSLYAQQSVILGKPYEYSSLDSASAYFVDSTNQMTFQEVRQQSFTRQSIPRNQPISYTYWLRFKVRDTLHYKVDYQFDLPYCSYGTLFQPLTDGTHRATRIGIYDKQAHSSVISLPEEVLVSHEDLDTSRYYYLKARNFSNKALRIFSSKINVYPVRPDTPSTAQSKNSVWQDVQYSIFLGLLAGLSIYFFFTFFFNKSASFLLYSLYLLFLFIYFLNRLYVMEQFWQETMPIMLILTNDLSMILSNMLYTMFVMAYLDLRKTYPKLFPILIGYLLILLMGMLWYGGVLLFDRFNPIHLGFFSIYFVLTTASGLGLLGYIVWKGVKGTAWIVVLNSVILIVGNMTSMLGGNFSYIIPFITVEVILFALGLGYQIRLNDLERLKTKEKLIEQLKINEQLQKEMQSKLEEEVRIQTQKAIEMTQTAELAKAEKIQTELLSELEQAKMKALQSQMNPHFIFNCLNSIRLYYMTEDLEKADDYITKFSRLIRSILNASRLDSISLKEELETLTLYMEFEQMRFKGKFDYKIEVAPNINTTAINIQSLILQPFVENAIWHGLMHSDKDGWVTISVKQHSTNSIKITIEDNGIGRAKAQQFKKGSPLKQKSFGLQITKERLDLLKRHTNKNATFEIIDLYDEHEEPSGTSVHIIYDL